MNEKESKRREYRVKAYILVNLSICDSYVFPSFAEWAVWDDLYMGMTMKTLIQVIKYEVIKKRSLSYCLNIFLWHPPWFTQEVITYYNLAVKLTCEEPHPSRR